MNAIDYIKRTTPFVAHTVGWAAKETLKEILGSIPDLCLGIFDANHYLSFPSFPYYCRQAARDFTHLILSTPIESSTQLNDSSQLSDTWTTAAKVAVGLFSGVSILNSYVINRNNTKPLCLSFYAAAALLIGKTEAWDACLKGVAYTLLAMSAGTFLQSIYEIIA